MLSSEFGVMQQILKHIHHWVWVKSYPDGVYVFANDAFCSGSGLTCEQIIGKTDEELWFSSDARHFMNRDEEVAKRKEPIIVSEYTPGIYTERRLVETMKFPIVDDDKNVVAVAGIARDLQWERDLAHYLQKSVEELEGIVRGG